MKKSADILAYTIALINEYGKAYGLTDKQSFMYLNRYGAVDLIIKNYEAAHTLSFGDNVEMLSEYCKRSGGELSNEVVSR